PWGTSYAQRPMLFRNLGGKKFDPVPAVEGSGLARVVAGHGLAAGDLFNDGKIDVVINVLDSHPLLLRNVSADHHHWVELKLVGGSKSPRDAVGATVYLTAGGQKQRGDIIAGASYASTHDPRLHFGLGDATTIDSVEVHWPSGNVQKFNSLKPDQVVTLTEGKDTQQ
ncbi:MAG TPA: ASPIC/UnbV domain-containing protein, partial [Edaphobacter sp.]|nr:ASPIC/UnbV domain-containing protein [Edaphobacter sp.]